MCFNISLIDPSQQESVGKDADRPKHFALVMEYGKVCIISASRFSCLFKYAYLHAGYCCGAQTSSRSDHNGLNWLQSGWITVRFTAFSHFHFALSTPLLAIQTPGGPQVHQVESFSEHDAHIRQEWVPSQDASQAHHTVCLARKEDAFANQGLSAPAHVPTQEVCKLCKETCIQYEKSIDCVA